jgi:hypothetical protein
MGESAVEGVVLFGSLPAWMEAISGSGYGDGNGNGSGDGYGSGDGNGSGDGSGDGNGSGDGYGNGNGSGDGYGNGDGYGYGYGDGSGDGDGDGYGYGYGNGYGDESRGSSLVKHAVASWPEAIRERFNSLCASASFLAFWKSDRNGMPSNGGSGVEAARPGLLQKVSGPLRLCGPRALHATLHPDKWRGDRLWIVALHGDVDVQDDKVGALEREIIGEVA